MDKKKVLVIEDQVWQQDRWRDELGDRVEVLSASSIEEAEKLFSSNPDLAAIVVDACVPGNHPNTPPLVRKFRSTFVGPMIAVSTLESYRSQLVTAGCNHQSTKKLLPQTLLQILGEH